MSIKFEVQSFLQHEHKKAEELSLFNSKYKKLYEDYKAVQDSQVPKRTKSSLLVDKERKNISTKLEILESDFKTEMEKVEGVKRNGIEIVTRSYEKKIELAKKRYEEDVKRAEDELQRQVSFYNSQYNQMKSAREIQYNSKKNNYKIKMDFVETQESIIKQDKSPREYHLEKDMKKTAYDIISTITELERERKKLGPKGIQYLMETEEYRNYKDHYNLYSLYEMYNEFVEDKKTEEKVSLPIAKPLSVLDDDEEERRIMKMKALEEDKKYRQELEEQEKKKPSLYFNETPPPIAPKPKKQVKVVPSKSITSGVATYGIPSTRKKEIEED